MKKLLLLYNYDMMLLLYNYDMMVYENVMVMPFDMV